MKLLTGSAIVAVYVTAEVIMITVHVTAAEYVRIRTAGWDARYDLNKVLRDEQGARL